MPLTPADARSARQPAAWLVAASIGLLASACGDDSAATVPTGASDAGDAGVEAGIDANVDPLPDVPQIDPDPIDANVPDAAPPPVPDAGTGDAGDAGDAGPDPTCDDVDCSTLDDGCNVGMCVPDTLECISVRLEDGTACGSRVMDLCTQPDTCQAGVCVPNHRAAGRPCGDQGRICHNDDACDGNGNCVDMGLWAVGTVCGDTTDSLCDNPDTCDSAGRCNDNLEPRGTGCGDVGVPCHNDDLCDGNGNCLEGGLVAADTLCGGAGEPPINTCHPVRSRCDAGGNCLNSDLGDGTPCGDGSDTACDNPDSCLGGFCRKNYETRGVACGSASNSDCDNPDTCNGFGDCAPNNEPNGTVCGVQSSPCVLPDACDMGVCASAGNVMNGMACGDSSGGECDRPDSCLNGTCAANHVGSGMPCGDQDVECHVDDTCDGNGACTDNGFASVGSGCGDQGVDCRVDDTCDAAGNCVDNGLEGAGTACGDPTDRGACDDPDSCDDAGNCMNNQLPGGTVCGAAVGFCIAPDACNDFGFCQSGGPQSPCFESVSGTVRGADTNLPLAGVTVTVVGDGTRTTTTAGDGTFTLEVPAEQQFLLQFGAVTGYWGKVATFLILEANADDPVDVTLTDDAAINALVGMVSGVDALDTALGIASFTFSAVQPAGGESATLDVSSASPFVDDPMGGYVLSDTLIGGTELWFINVETTTTNANVQSAPAGPECGFQGVSEGLPSTAHTILELEVDCGG